MTFRAIDNAVAPFFNRTNIMKIGGIRALPGPNVYSHHAVLLMKLDLEKLSEQESCMIPGFNERLLRLLPGLGIHHCAFDYPGGFLTRLREGTYFGHIVEHVALELQELAGIPAIHGKTRLAVAPNWYNVIIEYTAEQGARYLLETAVALVEAIVNEQDFPLAQRLQEAQHIIARTELGLSTRAIVIAAEERGIPWRRIGTGSLVQLGYGKERRYIQAAMTTQTSAVAVDIASDKELTKTLLRDAGIPVPDGMLVANATEAVNAFESLSAPVAVKPSNCSQGRGVSLRLHTAEQVAYAYEAAVQIGKPVIVEQQLSGRDYRVLVINGQVTAASERIPAHVIGDGRHTIAELIEFTNQDPARGENHDKALSKISIDQMLLDYLDQQNTSLNYQPSPGEPVYLRECANLSTGGTARDVTEELHPEIIALCLRAARVIGLDICGIDLILKDCAAPLANDNGIIEVNAAPGLRMHTAPSTGSPRDVGRTIIEMVYPGETNGRIPLITITGTNGKTTITRMIGHAFKLSGYKVGMTTTDGIFLNDERIVAGDTTGPHSAHVVLSDPSVEIAVLETARGGIVREGLGYDWSDVGIISNVQLDHIGQDGIASLEDILHIKSLVAERVRAGGTLVLNADDERLVCLPDEPRIKCTPKSVVWFSTNPQANAQALLQQQRATGGKAYIFSEGWLIESEGEHETRLMRAENLPVTLGGLAGFNIANALAAAAACRAEGLNVEQVRATLSGFRMEHNTGRAGLYAVAGRYVLIDYGHNSNAFTEISRLAAQCAPERELIGIIGVPGDRSDDVIWQAGHVAALGFHQLIIKEDKDLRGRRNGEVPQLLYAAARASRPRIRCRLVPDEVEALQAAFTESSAGALIVVFYEKLVPLLELLRNYGATSVDHLPPAAAQAYT